MENGKNYLQIVDTSTLLGTQVKWAATTGQKTKTTKHHGYGLGSEDPEEVAYYKQIKEEMQQDKGKRNLEILKRD